MKDNNKKSDKGLIIGLLVGIPAFFLIIGIYFINLFNSCFPDNNEVRSKMLNYFIEKYNISSNDASKIKVLDEDNTDIFGRISYIELEYKNKRIMIDKEENNNYCDDYQTKKLSNDISSFVKNKFNFITNTEIPNCLTEKYDEKNVEDFLKKGKVEFYIQANNIEEAKNFYINNAYKIVDYMEKLNKKNKDTKHKSNYIINFQEEVDSESSNLLTVNVYDDGISGYYEEKIKEIDENGKEKITSTDKIFISCKREDLVHGMCKYNY